MDADGVVLVTPEEAARRLSLGRTTVYVLISSGALASVRIGRSRRVPVVALDRYVERVSDDDALASDAS
jgi:excisionase family DNA binding protein